MRLSLIIPIYNESSAIDRCVQNLKTLQGSVEIIFVDGGSTDGTVARIPQTYRVISCAKGRARQMNAGAAAATGEVLWFSHCDSLLPAHGPVQIFSAVDRGAQFGCCLLYTSFFTPALCNVPAQEAQ